MNLSDDLPNVTPLLGPIDERLKTHGGFKNPRTRELDFMDNIKTYSKSCKLCSSQFVKEKVILCSNCDPENNIGYYDVCKVKECCCNRFAHAEIIHGGDWDWLARILGMSGPNGVYFCPFCYVKLEDLRKGEPHSPYIIDGYETQFEHQFQGRSAKSLFKNWEKYVQSGKSCDEVSEFKNCEFEPLIAKEGMVIDRVSLMVLHIALGLGKNLLDEYEKHAVELDCMIRRFEGIATVEMQSLLEDERSLILEKHQHEADLAFYKETSDIFQEDIDESKADNPEYFDKSTGVYKDKSREAIDYRKSVGDIRQEQIGIEEHIKDLKKAIQEKNVKISEAREVIDREKGLFQTRFDEAVENLCLKRQVYHQGALVGNDVRKLMEKASRKQLSNCFKPKIVTNLAGKTYQFSSHALRQRLYHFHQKLSAALELTMLERPLCTHEITILAWRTYSLGNFVPVNFEEFKISRKFHVLVHHAAEKAFRRGTVGMESEQCIEAMHVLVNKSQRMYSTLQDKKKRLELSLKSQWMKSDLDIPDFSVAKRRREKEE